MKITINTDVLKKYNLTLGEFLVMLLGHQDVDYEQCFNRLVEAKIIEPNLFSKMSVVLSDNSKDLVAKILVESDDKIVNSTIENFDTLAYELQLLYPHGIKPGTTYSWRGTTSEIAQKLRILIVKHNFNFTEMEAVNAVKEYVSSFNDYKYMQLLRNFILKTTDDGFGHKEIDSLFMTIIENNRKNENSD